MDGGKFFPKFETHKWFTSVARTDLVVAASYKDKCEVEGGFICKSGRCLSEEKFCDPFKGCEDKSDQEFQSCSGM